MVHIKREYDLLDTFTNNGSTHDKVKRAGETFVLKRHGASNFESLDKYSHIAYKMAIGRSSLSSSFQLASLPPTSAAEKQHACHTHIPVQERMGNTLPPTEWEWRSRDGILGPVETDMPVAPDCLINIVDGVLAVHEFHVWQLAGDRIIASAHIRCRNLTDYMKIAEKVKEFFHNEGIHSTTIQPEFVEEQMFEVSEEKSSCVLDCPPNTQCGAQTCCGPQGRTDLSPNEDGMLIRQRSNVGGSCSAINSQCSGKHLPSSVSKGMEANGETDMESGQLLNNPPPYSKVVIS
ncbi:Zinc transporter 1 [Nymphon striatum]|nr:Zinc transporter 1 [Nymphon striatum]